MTDIEPVINALQESGPVAASTVAGLWAAKRVAGPALDVLGKRLGDFTAVRLENLARIFEKAEDVRPDARGYPHPRVANRVLNDASLYDDDVMQTYTAGLIAGSRNDDGSDDRPVYYLGLMDSLTASQLSLFHVLYAAAAPLGPPTGNRAHDPAGLRVAVHLSEVKKAISRISPAGASLAKRSRYLTETTTALHVAGLIRDDGSDKTDGRHPLQTYWITRVGMLLYDWAHGFNDEDLWEFYDRDRTAIDLPDLEFKSARVV